MDTNENARKKRPPATQHTESTADDTFRDWSTEKSNEPPHENELVPPAFQIAQAAFAQELDQLLKAHYGQWVAYQGDKRLGFGRTETALYDKFRRAGLEDDEFLVFRVEAQAPDEELRFFDRF